MTSVNMRKLESEPKLELKAVILAGGKELVQGATPMVLQKLSDRTILEYVLANGAKHREMEAGDLDSCSSARWFDGWITPLPPPAGD